MRSLAKENAENLKALFGNTSVKSGLSPAIVEKDFWVCITLDCLFRDSPWRNQLAFKGGTSLSKAFNLIKRFSEDIDLILDWRLIGYGIDEPWRERSNTQQDIFNEQANAKSAEFLKDEFVPKLKGYLGEIVGRELDIRMDDNDPNTVVFAYPCVFTDSAILREIRIESGSLAAWTPARPRPISPYVASFYPALFRSKETLVYTVDAERTFWEKATILHREAMRTERQGAMPSRYSRHYYDLWSMCSSPVKDAALGQICLLDAVVRFKRKFYRCNWAKYELATAKSIKLLPPDSAIPLLESDYAHMKNMIFGPKPPFSEILDTIASLEEEIHSHA